jgi:nitrate/TMAO reductase-like tetraheme cytochrome c subunit
MDSMTSQKRKKPELSLFNNMISIFGFIVAIVFLIGEALIIVVDLTLGHENPYVGILIYIVGPSILIFGLLLVPIGMWIEHRRRVQGKSTGKIPVFDLNQPRHRTYLTIFSVVTLLFLSLSMVGSYQAFHITESNAFCGLLCHQVMIPEYTAYQHSPHARVDCVKCHIGPGADWFVKSKLSGAWQVVAVLTNSYELPIHTPIKNLRPARDTCEQCHWPEKFSQSIKKTLTYYESDEENTPYRISLLLNIGGSSEEGEIAQGIHWHIGLDHKLEYYATDEKRLEIPWVRVTYNDGRVETFIDSDVEDFDPESIPEDQIRVMDCIDCHNRPSHQYRSPLSTVNLAMDAALINPKIPEIKTNLVSLLEEEYENTQTALQSIEESILETYSEWIAEDSERKTQIDRVVTQTKVIYQQNIFPEQKVNWTKYPSHIGHFEFPGCYRCHNDRHMQVGGDKVIKNDCEKCHTIIRQGEGWDVVNAMEYKQQKFEHPLGFGDAWEGQNCHECHGPGMM